MTWTAPPPKHPAAHICKKCDVSWRDCSWSPSPCWSCGELVETRNGFPSPRGRWSAAPNVPWSPYTYQSPE